MEPPQSKRPQDTAFLQQRLPAWSPLLNSYKLAAIYLSIAVVFLTMGPVLMRLNDEVLQYSAQYDGDGTSSEHADCMITSSDAGTTCTISFTVDKTIPAPVYVFYGIENFYQNHRRYVSSYSQDQLLGSTTASVSDCTPLTYNGSMKLSPCGLIANTMFNDIFELDNDNYTMIETGIAWDSDSNKYVQPDGFVYTNCSTGDCASCLIAAEGTSSSSYDTCALYEDTSTNVTYAYYYPDSDTLQFLYQSYPTVISPIEGVENEHFQVWMRSAGLSTFRKPYGVIYDDIKAGTILNFTVTANWLVSGFEGKKHLVVSNTGWYGLANPFLGRSFVGFGIIQVLMAVFMVVKEKVAPRVMGDISLLLD